MSEKALQEGALEPASSPAAPPPAPNGARPGPAVNPLTGRPFSGAANGARQ